VPGWPYDAAATLNLGAWVTVAAAPGRDPTSADMTVAVSGVVVNSTEFTLSRHPDSEGVYILVFFAEYWARSEATGSPTVSFAAGTFVSPILGPLGAFSEPVTLVDCMLPTVRRGQLLDILGYECGVGAITCPSDGIWRASFVLEVDFSEPVVRTGGGPVTDADLQIYTVGGVATVTGTYVVQITGGGRRLSEGTTQLLVAVELSSGADGFEVVQIQAREGAICDGSGSWILAHGETQVVSADGNVLAPFRAAMAATEPAAPFPVASVIVPVGVVFLLLLLMIVCCLCHCRRRRRSKVEVRVGPRWGSLGGLLGRISKADPGTPKSRERSKAAPVPLPKRPHGKAAPADALAIVKQYEWLRAKEPHADITGRWIDALADAAVDSLRGAQPPCALPPSVIKTAHVVHSNLSRGRAPDDLEALRVLGRLLRDGPQHLPESLLMAAASLNTSAAAAMGKFGEEEAMSSLQQVLTSGRPVPKAVALGLGDLAPSAPAAIGYASGADAALKQQLAGLLRQREWYAYALTAVQGLMPDCLTAYASAGLKQPTVATDSEAVALVVEMVEMHARLGARQREAETRTHRAVEAPYQAWVRSRPRGGDSG